MRVRLDLSYDGAAFHGFQVQAKDNSVQAELCRALGVLFSEPIAVCGCSRTDAGVHARHFVCHACLPDSAHLSPATLKSINALVCPALSVRRIEHVSDDFHARYSATKKTYRYYLHVSPYRAPLMAGRVTHVPYALDVDAMRDACRLLVGQHDFRAFQAAGSKVRDTVREVYSCTLTEQDGDVLYLEISANGFLYRMVRNIAGTLIAIGQGKHYDINELLAARDRTRSGPCAPPEGLYLWQVDYEERSKV